MAYMIGGDLYKGNSNISYGVKLKAGQTFKEGMGVKLVAMDEAEVELMSAGGMFAGFIRNINADARTADLVKASAGLALPCDSAAAWAIGENASIANATSFIGSGAPGERKTNARIIQSGVTVRDAKTGEESLGVVVQFGMADDLGAVT